MDIYDEAKLIADELFDEFKQGTVEFGRMSDGAGPNVAYNPATIGPTWLAMSATVSGVSFKYLQNTLVVASDLQVMSKVVAGLNGDEPAQRDQIRINGIIYNIIQIDRKPASGTAVAYTFVVRR